jgi:hypothetical protein
VQLGDRRAVVGDAHHEPVVIFQRVEAHRPAVDRAPRFDGRAGHGPRERAAEQLRAENEQGQCHCDVNAFPTHDCSADFHASDSFNVERRITRTACESCGHDGPRAKL